MPPVKKQESLGSKLQKEQIKDELELCKEPPPFDFEYLCQFVKKDGSQCQRKKLADNKFCWSHVAVEAEKHEKQVKEGEKMAKAVVYKTVLCKYFEQGSCHKGDACTFAHGAAELRKV